MSFSYNPYRHFEFTTERVETEFGEMEAVKPYCHSCGASDGWRIPVFTSDSIALLMKLMEEHLQQSHKRFPEDFTDSSVY